MYLILLPLFAIFTVNAQKTNLNFDKAHTNVRFSVAHMVVSEVDGSFGVFDGSVVTEGDDFTQSEIEFTLDVNSVDTKSSDRYKHLKSADFFDSGKYPSIVFKSKSMKKVSDKKFELTGDLTMYGITKEGLMDKKESKSIEKD